MKRQWIDEARRRARRTTARRREAPQGELKKPRSVRFVTVMAFVLPGYGQVLNGSAIRGLVMQFSMLFCGFITYQLTTPQISLVGRLAGGLLVYVFSVIDANGIAKRRANAWERIEAGMKSERQAAAAARRPSAGPGKGGGRKDRRPRSARTWPAGGDAPRASS